MKRGLGVLVLALAVGLPTGVAGAQVAPPAPCDGDRAGTPLGSPIPPAPGWWECPMGTDARAGVNDGPPLAGFGSKSLRMIPGDNQVVVSTTLVVIPGGTRIVNLDTLVYRTYVVPVTPNLAPLAPTMQLAVDFDGDREWDTHLVFEPSRNANVVYGQWQKWDARAGLWWSTRTIPGVMAAQSQLKTLDQIYFENLAANGDQVTLSLFAADPLFDIRLQYGSSGGGYEGRVARVDGVVIKAANLPRTVHDFEDPITYLTRLFAG